MKNNPLVEEPSNNQIECSNSQVDEGEKVIIIKSIEGPNDMNFRIN